MTRDFYIDFVEATREEFSDWLHSEVASEAIKELIKAQAEVFFAYDGNFDIQSFLTACGVK